MRRLSPVPPGNRTSHFDGACQAGAGPFLRATEMNVLNSSNRCPFVLVIWSACGPKASGNEDDETQPAAPWLPFCQSVTLCFKGMFSTTLPVARTLQRLQPSALTIPAMTMIRIAQSLMRTLLLMHLKPMEIQMRTRWKTFNWGFN